MKTKEENETFFPPSMTTDELVKALRNASILLRHLAENADYIFDDTYTPDLNKAEEPPTQQPSNTSGRHFFI